MFGFICLILAIWLFIKFIGFTIKLAFGVLKIVFSLLGILIWPVALFLLLPMGLTLAALPIIIVCGVCMIVAKALTS